MTSQNQETLWVMVNNHLIKAGALDASALDDDLVPTKSQLLVAAFEKETGLSANDENIGALMTWMSKGTFSDPLITNSMTLSKTFTVNGQPVTITLGSGQSNREYKGRSDLLRKLHEEIVRMYSDVVNLTADPRYNASVSNPPQAPQAPSEAKTEMVTINAITKEMKNGKAQVRCHGGMWSKFGVAVYPECEMQPETAQFIRSMPYNTIKVTGSMIVEYHPDGKPKRVRQILTLAPDQSQPDIDPGW